MRKKRVLWHSNYCAAPTGFGTVSKEILSYLYKTGKYELFLYASGLPWEHPDFQKWPWKIYGTLPNDQREMDNINRDQGYARAANYGIHYIDRVIKTVMPDVYVGVEDFWGLDYSFDKKWWNKINCAISWTADSLPLLQTALDKAEKIKHHFVWADFATKEFHRLADVEEQQLISEENELKNRKFNSDKEREDNLIGFSVHKNKRLEKIAAYRRVKTLRGSIDPNNYYRLPDEKRKGLRKIHGIDEDCFCIGTLSRNQLRKLFVHLMEGFKIFRDNNPNIKCKLLYATSVREGWDLPRAMKEFNIKNEDILFCYKCRATNDYFVMPYSGEEIDNPRTGHKKSLVTIDLGNSLSLDQVNEWYNLLDCFSLPITSGGQERACQEAKLCELITLINPYSCFEDSCVPEAYSLPLEFSKTREIGTQFIKASVYPESIAKQLKVVYDMPLEQRLEWGRKAKEWTLKNFSIEVIGKQYEDFIDSLPLIEWDFNFDEAPKNPNANVPNIEDNMLWVKTLYTNVLNMEVRDADEGLNYWLSALKNGMPRKDVESYFRETAFKENQKKQAETPIPLDSFLDKNGKHRLLLVCKESIGDLINITALLKSYRDKYKREEWDIYFGTEPQYFEIFKGNENIDKLIPYHPIMDSEVGVTGMGAQKGYFDAYCFIPVGTQRFLNYLTIASDKISLKLDNVEKIS